jgi:hydroxyacylglutathione hydrolase
VYPTHGAGSFCSTGDGTRRTTTVGLERKTNTALLEACEDVFVDRTINGFGSFPPYFLRLREVNRRGPDVFGDALPPLRSLDVEEVARARDEGSVLVDVRPIDRFAREHVDGSLSIELRPAFATWLGWLVPEASPLVFVVDSDQDADDLVRQCLKIGYEDFRGVLRGGVEAWKSSGRQVASVELVRPEATEGSLVDIRQRGELGDGVVPGSIHVELADVASHRLPNGPLTLYCGHGERAMTAASLLEGAGRDDLFVMFGGPSDWSAATGRALV